MYVFDLLQKRTELSPDTIALVDTATGREYTYPQINERASRLAEFFIRDLHLSKGDRVAVLCQNSSECIEILYASAKAGLVMVPLNWRLAPAELQSILNDCSPRALLYDGYCLETAQSLVLADKYYIGFRTDKSYDELPAGHFAYEDVLAGASGNIVVMPERDFSELWYLLYTSGTTGKPKGVLQTYGTTTINALNIGFATDLTSRDTTLNLLPQFHAGGLNLFTNPTLHAGGTALIQRSFEPAETFRLLAARATMFFGVPAVYLFLSQHPDFEKTSFAQMRSWSCGGAPMPVPLLEMYATRGIVIRQGMGMTETGPTCFLIDEKNAVAKIGSVGKPQLYVETRIVGADGNDLGANEAGELIIRGPGITPGYWNMPEATKAAFTDDGWLRSGDIARRDEDGYYYIIDRAKDMYISGGENVYPAEIENVLYACSDIAEAAVIGVSDEKWGEVGKAVVVLKQGCLATESDVIAFCAERLAKFKVPKSVVFVDALPRNAAGKVVKPELRTMYGA